MPTDILTELERLAIAHGPAALEAGVDHLRDTRIAQSDEGRAAVEVLDALVDRYGDDALAWVFARVRRRLDRKVARAVAEGRQEVRDAAARAMDRIRAGNGGEGHE